MSHIFADIDALAIILKFFDIKEQINLCRVCDEFKDVIVQYIWRHRYHKLRVFYMKDDIFILNRIYKRGVVGKAAVKYESFEPLQKNEFERFLLLNKENLFDLELCDYRDRDSRNSVDINWNFRNLRILKLDLCQLHLEHLLLIKRNCLNLKVLHLNACLKSNFDMIELKDKYDPYYNGLLNVLELLTEFQMKYYVNSTYPLNLYDFVYEHNLKVLNLNISFNNVASRAIPIMEETNCEELHLGIINQYRVLQNLCHLYMYLFKNLQILALEGSTSKLLINTYFIEHLAVSAPKLRDLKLKRCEINVQDFTILRKLTEVTFDRCMNITWKNMNQLLQSTHIQSYCSNRSTYIGNFDTISLSNSLEKLTLVGREKNFYDIFADYKKPSRNLKYLCYYDGQGKRFTKISEAFPNLEVLCILPYKIDKHDFSRLTKLEVYENPQFKYVLKITELLFILKHPNLRDVTLNYTDKIRFDKLVPDKMEFKTNLSYLYINFLSFKDLYEPWYTLLKCNPQLTIFVRADNIMDLDFYFYNILIHRMFTRPYIKLSGFYIDVESILKTRVIATEQLVHIASELTAWRDLHIIM